MPSQEVSHAGQAGDGQQLSGGGAVWAVVEAHHLPQAAIVESLQLCPLRPCEGPTLSGVETLSLIRALRKSP